MKSINSIDPNADLGEFQNKKQLAALPAVAILGTLRALNALLVPARRAVLLLAHTLPIPTRGGLAEKLST